MHIDVTRCVDPFKRLTTPRSKAARAPVLAIIVASPHHYGQSGSEFA